MGDHAVDGGHRSRSDSDAGRSGQWETLGQQYLVPLTAHIGQPNPYNDGTVLEGVPWRDTYVDGMEGGYFFHVMEFFSIPTTLDNIRIFYNKDLFRGSCRQRSAAGRFPCLVESGGKNKELLR